MNDYRDYLLPNDPDLQATDEGGYNIGGTDRVVAEATRRAARRNMRLVNGETPVRKLILTPASSITPKATCWLWDHRIPEGELTLVAGREGIGKSSWVYDIVAQITRGDLPGESKGRPRGVIIAATEDSWEHTIVPRLMAARANRDLIYRIDVEEANGGQGTLILPRDIDSLEDALIDNDIALLLLDPLLSRLDGRLDTHKDSEVRQALEPLVRIAQNSNTSLIGLIHVNKSGSRDPLSSLMGSRAFSAVARAVLFTMIDPDDEDVRLVGLAKSNLGPMNVPTCTFTIKSTKVDEDAGRDVIAGKVMWGEERKDSFRDLFEAAAAETPAPSRGQAAEVVEWLTGFLSAQAGQRAEHSDILRVAHMERGYTTKQLRTAREKLGLDVENTNTVPRQTIWRLR